MQATWTKLQAIEAWMEVKAGIETETTPEAGAYCGAYCESLESLVAAAPDAPIAPLLLL